MRKKFYFILLAFLVICCLKSSDVFASLKIYQLDYDMVVNTDGSIDVTETWDMYINETNTIFKTFEYDSSRFSSIENVKVRNLTDHIEYKNVNKLQYHVDPNGYYGLDNKDGDFEIAWYAGFDESTGYKKYQIEYTVTDAVAVYKDYAEVYWKLVGDNGGIPIDNLNFTMHLPDEQLSKNDVKVWTHVATLKGASEIKNKGKVEARFWEVPSNTFVEVRTLFNNDNANVVSERTYRKNILDEVVKEETGWAKTANFKRATKNVFGTIVSGILAILTCIVSVWQVKGYFSSRKGLKNKPKPSTNYDYFRDLPRDNASAAQAMALMSRAETPTIDLGPAFSATLMMLDVKKYISFSKTQNEKGKEDVLITFLPEDGTQTLLTEDEEIFFNFLKGTKKDESANEVSMTDIKKYISTHTSKALSLNSKIKSSLQKFLKSGEYIDEEQTEKRNGIAGIWGLSFVMAIFSVILYFAFAPEYRTVTSYLIGWVIGIYCIFFLILSLAAFIQLKRSGIYTQKGVDEINQWEAFKKYMLHFSLLKDRELPELKLWEKYLVFATAFGISKKVIKKLKVAYPEYADGTYYHTHYYSSYMALSSDVGFNSIFDSSISSLSSAMSSGSGTGGGSSGGGGGGGGGGSSGGR